MVMNMTVALLEQPAPALRIAVITETYAPEINGVAHTMRHIVEALLKQGHTVELTRPQQACDQRSSAVGEHASADAPMPQPNFDLRLVRGQAIPRYSELQLGLAKPNTLAAHWRKTRPDVVHIVTEGPLGWAALIAARRLRIPISSGFHTNFHSYSSHYGVGLFAGLVDIALRALHNRCAITMVPTAQIRQSLQARGYQRLAVVGRGIDTVLFSPARRSQALRDAWGADEYTPVVLYVGRLAPEKNLQLFIAAAQAFRTAHPRTRIVLVGNGPDATALRSAHPDFIFAGTRTGSDLAAHYASADVFLFPSVTETFGNVTLEALASGLAVVAYDYAAARQHIVHEKSGWLVPFGNSTAFTNAAKELAESPARMVNLKQNARAAADRLSWDRIAGEFAKNLREVVDGYSAQPSSPNDAPVKKSSQPSLPPQSTSLPI
jgi:glycosyltransferase involved in cell wall biosynthesis